MEWGIPVERVAEIGKMGTVRVEELVQDGGDKIRLVFPGAKVTPAELHQMIVSD